MNESFTKVTRVSKKTPSLAHDLSRTFSASQKLIHFGHDLTQHGIIILSFIYYI